MSKQKHVHVILGTVTIAVPFNPSDLKSAVNAEAKIRAQADRLEDVWKVGIETRMTKLPMPEQPSSAPSAMPPIPAGLKR